MSGRGDDDDPAATLTRLRTLVERTRPVSTADQRVLPVLPAIEELLPARGLRRGSLVLVDGVAGATSMAFAVAAGPTRGGSWAACVGLGELGWAAAAEAGVEMERLVVVRSTPQSWAAVTAALVDAFDVVLCGLDHTPSAAQARRLQARARERGAVLVVVGGRRGGIGGSQRSWPGGVDLAITVSDPRWQGLGQGWGHLRSRVVTVEVTGRREPGGVRRVDLLLPGPTGAPAPAPAPATAPAGRRQTATGAVASTGAEVLPLRQVG
jgi:hypothetical protein